MTVRDKRNREEWTKESRINEQTTEKRRLNKKQAKVSTKETTKTN